MRNTPAVDFGDAAAASAYIRAVQSYFRESPLRPETGGVGQFTVDDVERAVELRKDLEAIAAKVRADAKRRAANLRTGARKRDARRQADAALTVRAQRLLTGNDTEKPRSRTDLMKRLDANFPEVKRICDQQCWLVPKQRHRK